MVSQEKKKKIKFGLFDIFFCSLMKTNFSRRAIVLYMFIIYFLIFGRKAYLSMHLLLIDTVKYLIITVKVYIFCIDTIEILRPMSF